MENWDLIVIGAGPAGLSAAIWGSDLGLRTLVLELRSESGGQLLSVHNPVKNYPGKDAASGRELRDAMLVQVERSGAVLHPSSNVVSADLPNKVVTLDDGHELQPGALIIATGVRRRKLRVPGAGDFAGKGILESGVRDRAQVAGRNVVIVGGGDAAIENALLLSDIATKVTIVHRGDSFKAREEFVSAVRDRENVGFLMNSIVSRILGDDGLTGVEISEGTETQTIECDNLLIRIGVEPNTELFQNQITIDADGYIVVDRDCRTSLAHVFAAGDVASPGAPTISTAVGMAATAAKIIASKVFTN